MEPLKDPRKDRKKLFKPPPQKPLSTELLFPAWDPKTGSRGLPDCSLLQAHFQREGSLHKTDLVYIITSATDILSRLD